MEDADKVERKCGSHNVYKGPINGTIPNIGHSRINLEIDPADLVVTIELSEHCEKHKQFCTWVNIKVEKHQCGRNESSDGPVDRE
ncbi:hypothetical protein PoB_004167500 [Plakobranchus ocellatus]|uniref:Uncharacterized protein n=1 Tax=Plakobranchus ocellatus TaxID=259542 RepID=A0AAV4B6K1_9GAST|nr:hypothetical protein PoB_004167500 [Plakobranchus ocellatus]